MPGEVVPLKVAAERDAETKLKERLLEWRNDIADKVIQAVHEDMALHFLDDVDDEEGSALDLRGDYDPIIDQKTGARLSDAIADFAEWSYMILMQLKSCHRFLNWRSISRLQSSKGFDPCNTQMSLLAVIYDLDAAEVLPYVS